jgi:hypothetical protein
MFYGFPHANTPSTTNATQLEPRDPLFIDEQTNDHGPVPDSSLLESATEYFPIYGHLTGAYFYHFLNSPSLAFMFALRTVSMLSFELYFNIVIMGLYGNMVM